mgnify:CR=1 FL=1
MGPFSLTPIVWLVTAAAIIGGAAWVFDKAVGLGETKTHALYAKAAEAVNLKIEDFTSEDERVAAISEAMRAKALADARKAAGDKCVASPEQAAALSKIR